MRASAIIVAAGSGSRLGMATPKAFVELREHPLLWYSLRTLTAVKYVEEAVLAVPSGMSREARAQVTAAGLEIPVKIVPGGAERQDSVRLALALTSAESEMVVVHDAARPFASAELFERCLLAARTAGGAIAGVPLADTLKRSDGDRIAATIPRAGLWQAQTPQAFRRALLIRAHEHAMAGRITATDDSDLVERLGATVMLVESAGWNLKITDRADLDIASKLVAADRR